MIAYVQGNLFESSAQVLSNAVNCVGIMGKGIALEFKKRYPAMFCEYVARCTAGQMKVGEPWSWEDDEAQPLMEKHLGSIPDLEVFVYPDQTLFGEFGSH
jgi:hypothetical protein